MIEQVVGDYTRRIVFVPSYDKRDTVPGKNYGICSMRMIFYVIGPKGAIQWMIGTDWYVASAAQHMEGFPTQRKLRPDGWDLGVHSHEPQWEGQEAMSGDCDVLNGKCFYDGSSLNAELPIESFLAEGDDYLWPKLEATYRTYFEGGEWPFKIEGELARVAGRYV